MQSNRGPPFLKHLIPFGTNAVAHDPKAKRDGKCHAEKGQKCIMVGYEEAYIHGYRSYKPDTREFIVTNRIVPIDRDRADTEYADPP